MPKFKGITVCHVNVRSILADSRLTDLKILCLISNNIDILYVTETWLNSSRRVVLPGFQVPYRHDRPDKRGGGVAVFVRNGLPFSEVQLLCGAENPKMDGICVKIHLPKSKHLFVVTAYRFHTETPSDFFTPWIPHWRNCLRHQSLFYA